MPLSTLKKHPKVHSGLFFPVRSFPEKAKLRRCCRKLQSIEKAPQEKALRTSPSTFSHWKLEGCGRCRVEQLRSMQIKTPGKLLYPRSPKKLANGKGDSEQIHVEDQMYFNTLAQTPNYYTIHLVDVNVKGRTPGQIHDHIWN